MRWVVCMILGCDVSIQKKTLESSLDRMLRSAGNNLAQAVFYAPRCLSHERTRRQLSPFTRLLL